MKEKMRETRTKKRRIKKRSRRRRFVVRRPGKTTAVPLVVCPGWTPKEVSHNPAVLVAR